MRVNQDRKHLRHHRDIQRCPSLLRTCGSYGGTSVDWVSYRATQCSDLNGNPPPTLSESSFVPRGTSKTLQVVTDSPGCSCACSTAPEHGGNGLAGPSSDRTSMSSSNSR